MLSVLFMLGLLAAVAVLLAIFWKMLEPVPDGLTSEQRAQLRHYCPQCRQLEENCNCAMC